MHLSKGDCVCVGGGACVCVCVCVGMCVCVYEGGGEKSEVGKNGRWYSCGRPLLASVWLLLLQIFSVCVCVCVHMHTCLFEAVCTCTHACLKLCAHAHMLV